MRCIRLLVIAFVLLVSAEPVYHTHPLAAGASDGSSTLCACAAGAQQITTAVPLLAAPAVVIAGIAPPPLGSVSHAPAITLPARAPPAA